MERVDEWVDVDDGGSRAGSHQGATWRPTGLVVFATLETYRVTSSIPPETEIRARGATRQPVAPGCPSTAVRHHQESDGGDS